MRLLVVTDPLSLSNVTDGLKQKGFFIEQIETGREALEFCKSYTYDALIIDADHSDDEAITILSVLRMADIVIPTIIISECESADICVRALEAGADDYIRKPVQTSEIVARLHAHIRRANGHNHNKLNYGPIEIDLKAHQAFVGGVRAKLTNKEYQMLELLCLKRGNVVSKIAFLDRLYGGHKEPEMKIIDVFICKLRKKLEDYYKVDSLIQTVWGRGYRLALPDSDGKEDIA